MIVRVTLHRELAPTESKIIVELVKISFFFYLDCYNDVLRVGSRFVATERNAALTI
jgi:hypothetical protein